MPEYFRFIRVTFDPSKYDAMMAHADSQIAKIQAVSGIRAVRVVRVADNQTITIGRYDSKEASDAATEQTARLWTGMAEFLADDPERTLLAGDLIYAYSR